MGRLYIVKYYFIDLTELNLSAFYCFKLCIYLGLSHITFPQAYSKIHMYMNMCEYYSNKK